MKKLRILPQGDERWRLVKSVMEKLVGSLAIIGAVWLAGAAPRAHYEATGATRFIALDVTVPAQPFDGDQLERFGGRRWFIMRTGGRWL